MSSRTMAQHVPNHDVANEHLAGAQFQIETLKSVLKTSDSPLPRAESCVNAAICSLLHAITASLSGFNEMLPDPVPPQRLSRRNLRDQFHAVAAESNALQRLESAAHPGEGWLWSLEQKHEGAAFGHLLVKDGSGVKLVKDPFEPGSGHESEGPAEYLNSAVDHVANLLSEIGEKASDDVATYRESQRQQARRLI